MGAPVLCSSVGMQFTGSVWCVMTRRDADESLQFLDSANIFFIFYFFYIFFQRDLVMINQSETIESGLCSLVLGTEADERVGQSRGATDMGFLRDAHARIISGAE